MIGNKYLTGETPGQALTFPGQAHFAIPGATLRCADCWFWKPKRQGDRSAVCEKAASMIRGDRPRAVPAYATICRHFAKDEAAANEG